MAMRTIGKYELLEEWGRGGFAVVYRARDTILDRIVALEVLHPHWVTDPQFATRFRQEAHQAANLHHSNIVTVYEAGEADGQLYIAMTFLPGRTLHDLLEEQDALPLEATLPILDQMADALDYAHAQGVVHRDVKPLNVMVEVTARGPRATLMDFGLVKALESSTALTSQGTLLGSPEYMAPEQADPNRYTEIAPATDRYALGIVAYRMLTGRVPFPGNTPGTLNAHLNLEVPNPRDFVQDLPPDVTAILLTMLAKAPADRFVTASAFVTQLREAQYVEQQRQVREKQLAAQYRQFQSTIQQESWEDAVQIGQRIQQIAPDYADVESLLDLAQKKHQEAESAQAEAQARRQREVRLTPLRAQLQAAVDRQDWPEVLRIGGQIQAIQPDDLTAIQWVVRARVELDRQRATEATALPQQQQATPPTSRIDSAIVKRWLVPILMGLFIVITFVCGLTAGPKIWEMLSPADTPTSTLTLKPATHTPSPPTNTIAPPTPTSAPALKADTPTPNLSEAGPSICTTAGVPWTRPADGMTMVCVPSGTFQMGNETGDGDEKPVHQVTLSAFWIDQTEVTNAQYRKCVEAGECDAPTTCDWGDPTYNDTDKVIHPVVCVNWQEAVNYCTWTGGQLPTEAQWEYAARGPEEYVYPWGNDFDWTKLNFCDQNCESSHADKTADDGYTRTAPAGSFPEGESWAGALDMAGNVWEWTADRYADKYPSESQTNPLGSVIGELRGMRGGCWNDIELYVRSSFRGWIMPTFTGVDRGFRCVIVRAQD